MISGQNLGVMFDESTRRFEHQQALMYPDGSLLRTQTFGEFRADVMAWVAFLRSQRVRRGDRVAAIGCKCSHHFRFFYACWWMGAIAVPVCETLGDVETRFILADCEPSLVLYEKSFAAKVQANAGEVPCFDWDGIAGGQSPDFGSHPEGGDPNEVAALIYTSGSTGMPKGVMLTHTNLWVNTLGAVESYRPDRRDRIMSLLPYWHSFALVGEVGCVVMSGCCCVIPKDIRDFKLNIRRYRPTFVLVVPRIVDGLKLAVEKAINEKPPRVRALIEKAIYNASRIFTAGPQLNGGMLRMVTHYLFYNLLVFRKFRQNFGGCIRFIISGGAPLDLEHQIFFKYLGMPIYQGYGLTETSPVVSANTRERHRLGSCGPMLSWLRPENGGDYTFKDEEGNLGKQLRGQLLIKGACVMKGYWRHADESAKTFEGDGWLNTGDMGYCDKDGYLFIQGRTGNMIVLIGGEKLHPEHVEDAVKSASLISEAMVFGEKCKNVYVCVNVPKEAAEKHTAEELQRMVREEVGRCTEHLASFQRPKGVLLLPDFCVEDGTLTATFKVRRHNIMQRYRERIEAFLRDNNEEIATKKELGIASSKVLESMEAGSVILGNGNVLK